MFFINFSHFKGNLFVLLCLQWNTIRSSFQFGGIVENSDLICHVSQRVRQSLLLSFAYIKTSSMNVLITKPSVSPSTKCWRSTQTGKLSWSVGTLLVQVVPAAAVIGQFNTRVKTTQLDGFLVFHFLGSLTN